MNTNKDDKDYKLLKEQIRANNDRILREIKDMCKKVEDFEKEALEIHKIKRGIK